jgi:hypothetical protein
MLEVWCIEVTDHPYWAYAAVPGTLSTEREEAALAEGRRAFALEVACRWDDTDEGHLATARLFEEYLKGGADVGGEVRLLEVQEAGHGNQEQPVQESLERRW